MSCWVAQKAKARIGSLPLPLTIAHCIPCYAGTSVFAMLGSASSPLVGVVPTLARAFSNSSVAAAGAPALASKPASSGGLLSIFGLGGSTRDETPLSEPLPSLTAPGGSRRQQQQQPMNTSLQALTGSRRGPAGNAAVALTDCCLRVC